MPEVMDLPSWQAWVRFDSGSGPRKSNACDQALQSPQGADAAAASVAGRAGPAQPPYSGMGRRTGLMSR